MGDGQVLGSSLNCPESAGGPLWVKNGPNAMFVLSPHYPKLRTLVGAAGRSVQCQNRTHAPQQTASSFDHLVGALLKM
jgi:hypothetical protein